ncbi:hypothetical protein RHOSPDRAFT_33920 [Rhodotorula sp. JG-1b]|nr:hypothetical protein RHOSPDRAFT_33920 [Rhodotorula sp. JG-1b]
MAGDWAQLKQRRAAKDRTATPAPPPPRERLDSWISDALPPTLAVEHIPGRGRGLVAPNGAKAGTTLLATAPLVSVLDARNLPHRCSHCFRSGDDFDDSHPPKLLQCSLCHTLQYCSSACQTSDWPIHKKECAAIRAAIKRRKESGSKHLLPDAPLRALARLLWSAQLAAGKDVWQQVESLESHRSNLTADEQERFFQLSVSLSAYVGQDTLAQSCPDGAVVIDLCSRFVSNSFALTCPTDLSNIGVSISPVTALINHSCVPNAVVVFPSFPKSTPSSSTSIHMAVVALRDLERGEEVVTSYVDLSLPCEERQKELQERYKDVHPAIEAAKKAYMDAEKAQYTDPRLAALQLSNLISALTTSLSPSPALAPSAYPLYSALQLLLTVQLHAHQFEAALATSSVALRGARALFPSGHPVLALLLTTHARLLTTPPASDPAHPEQEMQYWMATDRRGADVQALVAALKQVEVAFGDGSQGEGVRPGMKGGEMAAMLRTLIRDQEEGIEMGRRMRMAAQQQQQQQQA